MADKTRYWCAICYPENMKDDWEEVIGDTLELPYAYALHDKDHLAGYKIVKQEEMYQRKPHVHLMLVFPNTTTQAHALKVAQKLSKDGACCASTIRAVINIRHAYEYLIHNTETAKKQKKYQYDRDTIVTGNNFDIGAYEQISLAEKEQMRYELAMEVFKQKFSNYADFYAYVARHYDMNYINIASSYINFFSALTKGVFHKCAGKDTNDFDESDVESDEEESNENE